MPINDYDILSNAEITENQKIVILKLKKAWLNKQGGYKDGVISTDFYKAVLDYGIKNAKEFGSYTQSMRFMGHKK